MVAVGEHVSLKEFFKATERVDDLKAS